MFIEKINESFENIVDTEIDIDAIKTNGISIRNGNKLFKLSIIETEELPIDEAKKELKESYQRKLDETK